MIPSLINVTPTIARNVTVVYAPGDAVVYRVDGVDYRPMNACTDRDCRAVGGSPCRTALRRQVTRPHRDRVLAPVEVAEVVARRVAEVEAIADAAEPAEFDADDLAQRVAAQRARDSRPEVVAALDAADEVGPDPLCTRPGCGRSAGHPVHGGRDGHAFDTTPIEVVDGFEVVEREHPAGCVPCDSYVRSAVAQASVSGSTGCTYGDGVHGATVQRAAQVSCPTCGSSAPSRRRFVDDAAGHRRLCTSPFHATPGPAPMRLRNVRVRDDLWNAAVDRAVREGRSISSVIRAGLESYLAAPEPVLHR